MLHTHSPEGNRGKAVEDFAGMQIQEFRKSIQEIPSQFSILLLLLIEIEIKQQC